jgi:L-threonylcarbamoyladenylate synthase
MLKKLNNTHKCEHIVTSQDTPSKSAINRASKILRSGGIIIYPTDTLYGFGVVINNKKAVRKLYDIKKRDRKKPYSILINNIKQAEQICGGLTSREIEIFKRLLPGKITVLIEAKKKLDIPGFEHLNKVGFRIPESKLCQQLVQKVGSPLSSSSVNISYEPNIDETSEISEKFSSQVDLFLDAGPVYSLKGSTVIDLTVSPPVIVREGDVLKEDIKKRLNIEISSKVNRNFVVTFICSGNICRSPMAEGILKKKLEKSRFVNRIEVNSAGTLNLAPTKASPEAVKIAKHHQVDIGKHLSTPIDREILDRANIIICMASYHHNIIVKNYPEYLNKVFVLKNMDLEEDLADPSIADPIGMSEAFYEQIYQEIEGELTRIFPGLVNRIEKFLQ